MLIKDKNSGFTLIEMVVVLAIFGIITAILIPNIPSIRDKTSVDLVAQSVALHIRGAQVYGIGTRVETGGSGIGLRYGIHFPDDPTNTFLLFSSDSDAPYSGDFSDCGNPGSACVESYTLRNVEIADICYQDNGDDCDPVGSGLDIVYLRPSSEASFCLHSGNCPDDDISKINVTLQSTVRPEEKKVIKIWKNGQISVENE